MNNYETLVPIPVVIRSIRTRTPDIKTFRVSLPEGGKPFEHMPGQCAMVSVPGVGEAMFSITSSPTEEGYLDFSIKRAGVLTEWLHGAEVNQMIGVRGPYGNAFPVEDVLKGQRLLFVAGGVGLAPLRSVIGYALDKRSQYGRIDVVYGARSADDLLGLEELQGDWAKADGTGVHLTIDRPQEGWDGHVGFVPNYVTELGFDPDGFALVCGPPIMIRFTVQALEGLGYKRENIYTTMELRMKCGVGKCGRCNIGGKYVCKDGPVFRYDQLSALPDEY